MIRKVILVVLNIIMVTAVICGCNNVKSDDTTGKTTVETTEKSFETTVYTQSMQAVQPTQSTNDTTAAQDKWKKAYTDYIKNNLVQDNYEGYKLINIDNDSIPELVAIGSNEAQGALVCVYHDGNINTFRRMSFSYIEKENLLCNSDGHMDAYYDVVYSIKDGVLTKIASGNYGAENNAKVELDEKGNPIYVYKWDDVQVTKDEYYQRLSAIYNTSKATSGTSGEDEYSYEQIVNMIQSY